MKKVAYTILIVLWIALVIGAYYSISIGMLHVSLKKPYIVKKSLDLINEYSLVAFVDVNILPMDREGILEGQTVIVRDGIIEAIGDHDTIEIPEGALIIDGQGKYLMPGLIDMHVHIQEENELLLFVAHGITTVRNMWGNTGLMLLLGNANQLDLREKINVGELLGPAIYTSGPIIESPPSKNPMMVLVRSAEDAEQSVFQVAEGGYDFVKVYDHLSPELYATILDSARESNLPVVGHVPIEVGLEGVLENGHKTIEHLTGYIDMDSADLKIPEDMIDYFVDKTRDSGVWVVPTIVLHQYAVSVDDIDALEERPELKYVSPRMIRVWHFFTKTLESSRTYQGSDYPEQMVELATRMTEELHQGGAKILLGTDTDNGFLIPGLSLIEELQHLVNAGLSPYEAIKAGTRDAAEALGRLSEFGTVSVGKQADLILVESNPFENVTNVNKRVGVMINSHWFPEEELGTMLDELADSYVPTILDRMWFLIPVAIGVFLVIRRMREVAKGRANKDSERG